MSKLISKVQYKNFEAGEFIDIQERTYEETITLIENYPWNSQRDKIVIDLTNPSITIEGRNNDFLKYALFFNQKYVAHYFNETQVLFTKSFFELKDGYDFIKRFFEQPIFDASDFKKEITWLQHNFKHFLTQDFNYFVTSKSIKKYLLKSSGMNFFFSIFIIILLSFNVFFKGIQTINLTGIIVLLFLMFFMGGGLHLILFFNYYNYVKDKILIMSKGNDTFYFGEIGSPVKYNKKDIVQYTTIRSRGSRNQFIGFAIVEIELNSGEILKIPNLLVDYSSLENKLYEYPKNDINKFPILRL